MAALRYEQSAALGIQDYTEVSREARSECCCSRGEGGNQRRVSSPRSKASRPINRLDLKGQLRSELPKSTRWSGTTLDDSNYDLVFVVDGARERIPAHSFVLANSDSAVFRRMFSNYNNMRRHCIAVTDVEGRAFDILLKYLYTQEVRLTSVMTALTTLYAANKFVCPGLASRSVAYLREHLNESNVLLVVQHISLYTNIGCNEEEPNNALIAITEAPRASVTPSAPPFDVSNDDNENNYDNYEEEINFGRDCKGSWARRALLQSKVKDESSVPLISACDQHELSALLRECYALIDACASHILASEDLEDADLATFKSIICRSTLCLRAGELEVVDALMRWSSRELRRQKLPLNAYNRRQVLEGAQYLVRYLVLDRDVFRRDVKDTGLLSVEEAGNIEHVLEDEYAELLEHLRIWRQLMSSPREGVQSRNWRRRLRRRRRRPNNNDSSRRFSVVEELFVCLACIFD